MPDTLFVYIMLPWTPLKKIFFASRIAAKNGGENAVCQGVQNQYAHRIDDLTVILPYCDCADFYDNYNGFVFVAQKDDGHIEPVGDYHPQWITKLLATVK